MFGHLIRRFIAAPGKVAGVEMRLGDEGSAVFDYILIEKKSGKATVVKKSGQSCSWDELLQQLPKGIPIGLAIEGKGVLVKKAPSHSGASGDALSHIIPNIQIQDFAFQFVHLPKTGVFALVRADVAQRIIRQLGDRGHRVLACNLSFCGLAQFPALLMDAPVPLKTSRWDISHADGHITDFQLRNEHSHAAFLLSGTELTDLHLAAFTSGLHALLDTEFDLHHAPSLDEARRDYLYEQAFRFGGISFLTLISALLLINTLLFFQYSRQSERQSITLAANEKQLVRLDSLQQSYREKQQFLEGNSLMRASITAWYADRIGASVSDGIRLNELYIFPPEQSNRKIEAEQRFQSDLIRIKGVSRQSTDLNRWLKTLRAMDWVKEVKVLPYSENREGRGEFELEVKVKQ